jgi:hypothetical protein
MMFFPPATTMPDATPEAPAIAVARLGVVTGEDHVSNWLDVQFNPASLQLQVSNELKDTANNERKQYVAKSNAKLTMELLFDTTLDGQDVTATTRRIQAFISPELPRGNEARQRLPPPLVMFEWGRVKFKGIAESYKETIDFFSSNGVPLRSTVNLTLSRQDQVFDAATGELADVAGDPEAAETSGSAADVTNRTESPGAARTVAAANGQENLRFGDGSPLTLNASITLKPPAAFAAGGLDLGLQGGLGVGGGASLTAGASLGAGLSVSAGASLSAGVSAGVAGLSRLSATEGAFSALRATTGVSASARLNTSRLLPQVRSLALTTDRHATFQVGGRATLQGSAGMGADVGARSSLGARVTFDPR